MKKIGFLSLGHWTRSPHSQTRTAADALLQSIDLAVAAEALGADGAYFRVHHFARQLASPFPLLAAVGAKTSRIEIGTAVIDMRYENPLYMVEDAGAADLIAGGRLQLGISRGSPEQVIDGWSYFGYRPAEGQSDADMGRRRAEVFLDLLRGEGFARPNPRPMFSNPPGLLRVEPLSEGLRDRIWWGAGSNATAVWAAKLGVNLQSSTLKEEETGEPFHVQQAAQIRAFRAAWKEAGHAREPLNQLLAELDGFDPTSGVILIGATNRPEVLDPALLRPGRFDRQVLVDRPDRSGRLQILKVHVAKIRLANVVDLDQIAGLTTGFTDADLANLVNEAAIVATRRKADAVTFDDFTAAIERIVAGLEKKSRVLCPAERGRVAHHEMGHALVAATLPGVDPVHKVSIIPRGVGALGYTMQRPTQDRFLLGRQELENRIAVLMGGRALEALVYDGEVSTGASDDLQRATQIAVEMVTRYGMNETVGQRTYAPTPPQPLLAGAVPERIDASDATEREIDVAVRDLVAKAYGRASDILRSRRADLDEGARLLLMHETLTADQFPAIRPIMQPVESAA